MKSQYFITELEPRFWKLFLYSIVPIVLAVGVGLWLAGQIHKDADNRTQAQRTEEVIAQDRLLVDTIWGTIETIKAHALGLEKIRAVEPQAISVPEGVILHWAQFEIKDGKVVALRQAVRNPGFQANADATVFKESFENWYLTSAQERLNLQELRENGVSVLRIKQDAGQGKEWLAFAFQGAVLNATAQPAQAPVVLALVDPAEAFPVFRRWTSRSEGGNLRGYMVGSDGFVISHSQHSYVASDFSPTQVFTAAIQPMMQGKVRAGAGIYKAIDKIPVTVAYARPGTLPLGVVVERVNPQLEAAAAPAFLQPFLEGSPADPLVAMAAIFLLITFTAAGLVPMTRSRSRARSFESTLAAENANEPGIEPEFGIEVTPVAAKPKATPPVKSMIARTEVLPAQAQEQTRIEEQLLDGFLSDESAAPAAQKSHADRVALARFETETLDTQDTTSISQSLVATASKLSQAPALFFSFRETMGVCLLQAHSGLPFGTSTQNVSYSLSEAMRTRITRYQKEGKTASLSDDPQLALLLAKRFGGARCEAWPVSGKDGKLLGVLAVLGGSAIPSKLQNMEQVLRVSANRYEVLRGKDG